MQESTRICPKCQKILKYTNKANCKKAADKQTLCRKCGAAYDRTGDKNPFYGKTHTLENRLKISKADKSFTQKQEFKDKASARMLGKNNPSFGISNYDRWVSKYGKEKADILDRDYRIKQSNNSKGVNNPMYGKPTPQGSGNGWSGWYNGWFFRSLLELSYVVNVLNKKNLKWESAEKKNLSIPYVNWDGSNRTYRADFIVEDKYLIEIKPQKLISSPLVKIKRDAANCFCEKNGLEYKLETVDKLKMEQLIILYKSGSIVFTKRYEKIFKERYLNE